MACFSASCKLWTLSKQACVIYHKIARLHDKAALVTGSTSGIGRGIAEGLAYRGCNVILNGYGDDEEIRKTQKEISKKYGKEVHFIGGDLSNPDDIIKLVKDVFRLYPSGLDILVNNAGVQFVSPIETFPKEKWDLLISLMLTAPFLLIQNFLPAMKTKGWGRIVNISSVHGLVASPNKAAYVSAKHGIMGLSKVVALETAGSGVTCNTICPGYVETPLLIKQAEQRAEDQGISVKDAISQIVQVHASGQSVSVKDVSDAVCFLCSSGSSQITGSSITLDGGWTAR